MTKRGARRRHPLLRIVLWAVVALVVVFVLIQLVPYGRDHRNPPVTNAFTWASPRAEAIARESCYDCHSNETKWWWAVEYAPFSWLTQRDIDEGRTRMNFSEWNGGVGAGEFAEAVNEGMPPLQYVLIHPGAKLTDAEKRELVARFRGRWPATRPPADRSHPGSPPHSGEQRRTFNVDY